MELSKFEYSVFENLHFNYNDAATLTKYIVQAVSSRLFLFIYLMLDFLAEFSFPVFTIVFLNKT